MTHALTLYHMEYCPFCIMVRRAAAALNIPLNLVDINDHPEARAMLMARRGRATVPVLLIPDGGEGTLLPESRDIVAWLDNHARKSA